MRCEEEEPCGMRRSDAGSLEPSAGRRAGTRVRCTCSSPECSACAQSSACSLCALVQLGSSRRARMCPRAQRDEGKRTSGLMLNVVSLVRMFSKHGTTDSSSFANSHLHAPHTKAQGVHTSCQDQKGMARAPWAFVCVGMHAWACTRARSRSWSLQAHRWASLRSVVSV